MKESQLIGIEAPSGKGKRVLVKSLLTPIYYGAFGILLLVAISWSGSLDVASDDYLDDSIVQATVAFGAARALNAVISVVQTTTLSSVVVSITPGEVLDPIDDLVEQYSTLMKYAISSLLIQKLLLTITSNAIFKVILTFTAVIAIATVFWHRGRYFPLAFKFFVSFAFLRFALILVVLANGLVNDFFLNEEVEKNMAQIEAVTEKAEKIEQTANESSVDPEVKAEMENKLQVLFDDINIIKLEREKLSEEHAEKVSILVLAEETLGLIEEELSITQRMNIFNRTAEHEEAITKRDAAKKQVAAVESELSNVDRRLAEIEEQIIAANNTLEGKPNGVFEMVGSSVASMAGGVKDKFTGGITSLVAALNNSIDNVLNLMAAFILKTMILPLLFLYLLMVITKAIWNVDLRQHDPFQKKQDEIKNTTMVRA